LELAFDLAEDFADLVFDRVGPVGALLEALEIAEEVAVDEVDEVVAGECGVVVEGAVGLFGGGPGGPAMGRVDEELVGLGDQFGFNGPFLLQVVEVF
jgi:hypothetical protein